MSEAFDAAAFRAALKALGEVKPKAIKVPGVGRVYRRELTVADVEEAPALRAELAEKHPQLSKRRLAMAVGLAQVLCGPDGTRIFNPEDPADIQILADAPWESVRGVTADDEAAGEGAEKNA